MCVFFFLVKMGWANFNKIPYGLWLKWPTTFQVENSVDLYGHTLPLIQIQLPRCHYTSRLLWNDTSQNVIIVMGPFFLDCFLLFFLCFPSHPIQLPRCHYTSRLLSWPLLFRFFFSFCDRQAIILSFKNSLFFFILNKRK